MASRRQVATPDAKTRIVILDAAELLMLEEGWAAVTSRRVAERANLGSQLVHYHFGTMDDLLRAVFQRQAEHGAKAHADALASDQPLWALWRMIYDAPFSKWTVEVLGLASHRPLLAAELRHYADTFRREQAEIFAAILRRYGVDEQRVPPMAVAFLLTVVPGVLFMETQLNITTGHTEIIEFVERCLREVEGDPAL